MLMTKTFIWIIAILVALLGAVAATEVPVSGILIILAACLITPLSPIPKWSSRIAALYQDTSYVLPLRILVYLLPALLLGAGFIGISKHTLPTTEIQSTPAGTTMPASTQQASPPVQQQP